MTLPRPEYVEPTATERKLGLVIACRDCEREWPMRLAYRETKRCIGCQREWYRLYRQATRSRAAYQKSMAGYSTEIRLQKLVEQKGRCAICGTPFVADQDALRDHCHETGYFRALLCCRCNVGLGQFQDSPERLRLAADYIEAHRVRIARLPPLKKRHPVDHHRAALAKLTTSTFVTNGPTGMPRLVVQPDADDMVDTNHLASLMVGVCDQLGTSETGRKKISALLEETRVPVETIATVMDLAFTHAAAFLPSEPRHPAPTKQEVLDGFQEELDHTVSPSSAVEAEVDAIFSQAGLSPVDDDVAGLGRRRRRGLPASAKVLDADVLAVSDRPQRRGSVDDALGDVGVHGAPRVIRRAPRGQGKKRR